ncbi:MAG: undecaprenyl-diphosphate phosphatase [Candidatus Moraniibacteriota bacterium]|nr:MAG: undecaprenyl-diphosphate phosphatase [Candidatus Moranbacteria bacterium]
MSFFDAFILGIVEGISEFLPISSTGHLILASRLLNLSQTEFLKMFEVVIQLGAILSVIVLYARKILHNPKLIKKLIVAMIPSLIIGGLFYSFIKKLFESEEIVVGALFFGGILIILFEIFHKEKKEATEDISQISYKTAFFVGVFQVLSVIPGVSRSGATILGGLFLGLRRKVIVEFSFLLAVPTMLAASTLDIVRSGGSVNTTQWGFLIVGFLTAFVVSLLTIKWLLRFVETNTFIPFGIYRIGIALLFFLFIL